MKKLMITAAAALCATVGFSAGEIAYANIVGYMNGDINASGNNFITAPFFGIGYNTTDIQDIKLVGSSGYMTETFAIWEGVPSVVADTEFLWMGTEWNEDFSVATKGEWTTYGGETAEFSIPGGQAVTINADPSISIQNAGQVPTENIEFTLVDGNNFTGNPYPSELNIQNIKLVGSSGYMTETFAIWEGVPSVVADTEFLWMGTEWNEDFSVATKGEWTTYGGETAEFTLDPYQGCVINGAAGIKVEISAPYSL